MEVVCKTNLDLYREIWPTKLPAAPRVGDYIESKTIHSQCRSVFQLRLVVVAVTWKFHPSGGNAGWYPEIELHCRSSQSVRRFYEWYAPLVGKSASYFI